MLNCVLWILRTGAQLRELPSKYPPYQTCHRRFQSWQRSGLLTRLLQNLAEDLRDRGKIDLSETFIEASFSSAKKGALLSARLAAEKAAKSWRSQTAMAFLSPAASPAHRRMKQDSRKPPYFCGRCEKFAERRRNSFCLGFTHLPGSVGFVSMTGEGRSGANHGSNPNILGRTLPVFLVEEMNKTELKLSDRVNLRKFSNCFGNPALLLLLQTGI